MRRFAWFAVLVLSTATMAGCEKLNETLDAALEKVAQEEGASTTRRARSATGPNPAFEARERRGSWNLRLWVGLWCDRDDLPRVRNGAFTFFVDDVEMYTLRTSCGSPGAPRVEEPNGGSFAFTLGQGDHTLRVVTPDGDEVDYALDMAGDSWLVVHHAKAEEGEGAQTTFDLRRTRSSFDDTYVEEEAPLPPGSRGRTDLSDSRTLPRGAAARGALEARAATTTEAEQGDDGVAPDGDISPQTGEASPRSEAAPSGASDDDEGWLNAANGSLTVLSREPAEVFIDGRGTGRSAPMESFELPEGRHRVELRDASGETIRAFSVDIEAGRNHRLVH